MRLTALTCLLLTSMMLAACGSPSGDDGMTCGPGTEADGDQCVGTGGSRPDATPSLSTNFSDVAYSFVRYSYVMSLSSDGVEVVVRIVFDDTSAPIMQLDGTVTGATTFDVTLAGVDVNGDLEFAEGEVYEATGSGTLDTATNYDGQEVQVLTIDDVVIGGEEFGFIDGILDSTFSLEPSE